MAVSKLPKKLSPGEEGFALHCKANKVLCIREFKFSPVRRWKFDFVFPEIPHLAVEVEGGIFKEGRHSRGVGMEADMEKYNRAAILGWKVLRYSTAMVLRGDAIGDVLEILAHNLQLTTPGADALGNEREI
jgi:hypothetical protein